ncbi:cytochrome c oxidase subunit 3 [Spirosoma spitsbergense]|jgi:heme/copper-type cytochrome/quinol oxidase subunit 3|uniref:cytochrome c oxidase subunit 3 n=1 Tax=Spirosoma spitsbergense TaxID=431554 RepID=UPI00037925A7|nr:cytochrome c oxidase subunit 3 [Spirosoma spitsbergense]
MESKLMMKLVVGSEAIFFLALMMGFVYFAYFPGFDPKSLALLDLTKTGAFTVLLLASSFTFWRAEISHRNGQIGSLKGWLAATVGLGVIFLFGQGMEYNHLLVNQLVVSKGTFATGFFTLTGFHGLHVFIGLIMLAVVLYLTFLGDFDRPQSSVISAVGIYWHFVDIVWVIVFTLVYILPHVVNMK